MKSFNSIKPKQFPNNSTEDTVLEKKETRKFKNYKVQLEHKNLSSPIAVQFAKNNIHNLLFVSEHSLTFFDLMSDKIITNYPNTKQQVFSAGTIREDGRLIITGNNTGGVTVYEPYQKIAIQNYIKPFKLQVNSIDVIGNKLIACSNDSSLGYFSLESKDPISHFKNISSDYLVCSKFINENLIVTGGLDKKIKFLDLRSGKVELEFISANNQIINDICVVPQSKGLLVASNDTISNYDLSYLSSNNNFTYSQNYISSVSPTSSSIKKMIISDRKIFSISSAGEKYIYVNDLFSLKKLYSVNLKTEILDFDIVKSLSKYALIDSTKNLKIFHRNVAENTDIELANQLNESNQFKNNEEDFSNLNPEKYATKNISKNYAYFNRGQYSENILSTANIDSDNIIVQEKTKRPKLSSHDQLLKKFLYKEALQEVLKTKNPSKVISLLEYFIENDLFYKTILKMSGEELQKLLVFIKSRILSPKYQTLMTIVFSEIINFYYAYITPSNEEYGECCKLIEFIITSLKEEIEVKQRLMILENKVSLYERIKKCSA